ncbi:VOC family protein [Gordonia shandongensis]|uniref:VOC family protein n=1 Tax=Gordonia shandongensis TaxID=376351 RepID=UPI00068864D5|nr:VOC family protein [Gordonia shandongensis]
MHPPHGTSGDRRPPVISAVTLGVRDVARSTEFYVDGLGFRPISSVPDEISFVQAGHGLLLALWNIRSMPQEYGDVAHGRSGPPVSLGHNVDHPDLVHALFDAAVAAGATVVNPPSRQSWGGVSACVADPDGFRWDFVHNPGFAVASDGTVISV